jgi:uncharacterized protein YkwD
MRRVLFAVGLLALILPAAASDITPRSVIAAMNVYRQQHGQPPLREDPRLAKAANERLVDMEDLEYWGHESPDGRSPFVWLKPAGYDYQYAGENLAAGFETTELLLTSWMESPGHRSNILFPLYEDCGVAVVDGATTGPATGRSIVVLFGRAQNPSPKTATK